MCVNNAVHTLDEKLWAILVKELVAHDRDGIQGHNEWFGASERNGSRSPTHREMSKQINDLKRKAGMVSELLFKKSKQPKKRSCQCRMKLMQRARSKAAPKKPKKGFAELRSNNKSRSGPPKKIPKRVFRLKERKSEREREEREKVWTRCHKKKSPRRAKRGASEESDKGGKINERSLQAVTWTVSYSCPPVSKERMQVIDQQRRTVLSDARKSGCGRLWIDVNYLSGEAQILRKKREMRGRKRREEAWW